MTAPQLLGVGFHDRPSPRRPIWAARALARADRVDVAGFEASIGMAQFDRLLSGSGRWVGAFDFPLGMARELVAARAWPQRWDRLVSEIELLGRAELTVQLRDFCALRPRAKRLVLRATERLAGAEPAMGRRGTRHALRFQAGAPRLLAARVTIPGIRNGAGPGIALEGNPALVAATITRGVWRSGVRSGRGDVRELERERLVDALERGHPALGVRLRIASADRAAVIADDGGARLAALLCLAQAAWSERQPRWGLPARVDPLEGWIVGADLPLVPAAP